MRMRVYKKAILPIGFKASAAACGIKKRGRLDLALFYSRLPAKAACCFTANKIQAAPLLVNKRRLKGNRFFQAIIVNSGNANCFTGAAGLKDAQDITAALAEELNIKKENTLAASTGIIGRRLPLAKIKRAVPALVSGLSARGISRAKTAIMTTDTFAKEVTVKFNLGGKEVTVCGVAKGAGMIAPDMATMLCFIFTDADIAQRALDKALRGCVAGSFNCITVDGCMSTNDMVIALANSASASAPVDLKKNFAPFAKALEAVCGELARLIVRDAEGATKFIQINVNQARSFQEARKAALGIANSNLFKTAMYGENPNFGRIVAAIGAGGIAVKEKNLKIKASPLNKRDININVWLGRGRYGAKVYTSDLAPEYVKINAGYS